MTSLKRTTLAGLITLAAFSISNAGFAFENKAEPIEGILTVLNTEMYNASYSCSLTNGSARVIKAEIDTESQMLELTMESDKVDYRGVATRTRYEQDGEKFVGYYLSSEAPPYFYNFVLTTNLTQNRSNLTLVHNGGAFNCVEPAQDL